MNRLLLFLLAVTSLMTFAAPIRGKLGANAIDFQTSNGYKIVEVEYIESSGVEYIDTKTIITGDSLSIEMDMSKGDGMKTYAGIMGVYDSNIGEFGFHANGAYYIQFRAYYLPNKSGYTWQTIDWTSWKNRSRIRIEVENETAKYLINGASKSTGSVIPQDYNRSVWLFAINGFSANEGKFIGKCYGAKISIDGELVRDFQPVRLTNVRGQSEGAMYDKVSGQIFRNSGTGTFIVGPDKQED